MRSPIRNSLFVIACLAICFSAFAHKMAMVLHVVPVVTHSYLEGREYQRLPHPSIESVTSGSYQDGIEQYVADSIPARDDVMLINAGVQRGVLTLSNRLFGFSAYPTYYGSGHVYVPNYDAVAAILDDYEKAADSLIASRKTLAAFIERHPECSVFVMEVDEPRTSSANPTYDLMSSPSGTQEAHELLLDDLPGNATLVGHDNNSADELYEAYYRSDHHWTTHEGYRNYVEALAVMKPDEEPAPIIEERIFDVPFYGSLSRSGLCKVSEADTIVDLATDVTSFKIRANKKKIPYDKIDSWDRFSQGYEVKDSFENMYASYYHGDYGLLHIANPSAVTQDSLLLVGNSYLNCIERFFAHTYAHVYKIDGRYSSMTADQFLARHPEIRDVLVVGQPAAILAGALDPA